MQAFEVQYRHGPEERADLLRAFEAGEGDLDRVYESVMLSNVLDDDERFRGVLEEAIKSGEVTAWDAYVNEPEAKRMKRRNRAEREAKEAAQWVKEDEAKRAQKKERLGLLNEKAGPRNKASRERSSMQELAAAIGGRQIARQGAGGFLERLEEKYAKPTRARAKKGEVTHKMKRKEAAMQKKKNGLLSHGGGFRVKDPEEEDDVKGKKGKKRRRDPGVEEEEADGDVWEGTDGEDDGPAAGEPDEDAFMQTQKRMLADSEARREKRESGADQKTESGVAGKGKGKGKSRAKKRKTAAS